jgi:hypothetical protein
MAKKTISDLEKKNIQAVSLAIDSIDSGIKTEIVTIDSGNQAILNLWGLVIPIYENTTKELSLKKQDSWRKYFQPELEKRYGKNRGFSLKSLELYRRIIASEKKTQAFLEGNKDTGKRAKLTPVKRLENAITTINKLISNKKVDVRLTVKDNLLAIVK